jgi:hypothetical protein
VWTVCNLCRAGSDLERRVRLAEWLGAPDEPDPGCLARGGGESPRCNSGPPSPRICSPWPPTAMVWLRLITSAVVLLIMARPRLTGHSGRDWLIVLGFGVSLMIMNWSIYQSFARIPLGIAVTIEFFGPLAVAVVGSRRLIDLIWVVLAAEAWRCWDCRGRLSLSPAWGFALLAAVAWAGYILLSAQTGRCWPGLTGLAIASVVGATVLAPPAIPRGRQSDQPDGACAGRRSWPAQLSYPLQLRVDRPTPDSTEGLWHSDESGASRRSYCRNACARSIPDSYSVARHGLRGDCEYWRHSGVDDVGTPRTGLRRGPRLPSSAVSQSKQASSTALVPTSAEMIKPG